MSLSDLSTPALLIERPVVERNCAAMLRKARSSGVVFRPHVKTHKTIEGALLQHGGVRGPICVSTLAEAGFFAAAGFDDITWAFPIAPEKIERAAALARTVRQLNLLLDHPATLAEVERFHRRSGQQLDFFLKVDCGYHRAGVDPQSIEGLALARAMGESVAIRFNGLLTHAGHSYHASGVEEIRAIAARESGSVADFAKLVPNGDRLTRSVGSTPTMSVVERFIDCDEVRPGNYIFYDAYQARLGSCSSADAALSVLTTVVGVYPEQKKVICDAGSLALSREAAAGTDSGYGVVCDEQLRPLPLRITSLSQEHGQIYAEDFAGLSGVGVGTRLRIVANHSCITAAMFDRYHAIAGNQILEEWRPVRGW